MEENQYYQIPDEVFDRDSPFEEFKQDASIVSVILEDDREFSGVLVLYPNYIISVKGYDSMPFDPKNIIKVFQSTVDLQTRSESSWVYYPHPWSNSRAKGI